MTLFCEIVYCILQPASKLFWAPGGTGEGKSRGKENLHSRLINVNICILEWDAKCSLADF